MINMIMLMIILIIMFFIFKSQTYTYSFNLPLSHYLYFITPFPYEISVQTPDTTIVKTIIPQLPELKFSIPWSQTYTYTLKAYPRHIRHATHDITKTSSLEELEHRQI